MCGIVGFIGEDQKGVQVVLDGLRALEYRGYDSAGIAYRKKGSKDIHLTKQTGRVEALATSLGEPTPASDTAIGHTRWATHGSPTVANAHPHFNKNKAIMVVHNGIIENYVELKAMLTHKGYKFVSDTDTEVIAHLLDYYYEKSDRKDFDGAVQQAVAQLQGAYGLLVMTTYEPDTLYAARLGSPLVLGVVKPGSYIVASDPAAILSHTNKVVYLNDREYVSV